MLFQPHHPLPHPFYFLLLFFVCFFPLAHSVYLPALRARPLSDEKRALATRLLRTANSQKDRSLHDVLTESPPTRTSVHSANQGTHGTTPSNPKAAPSHEVNPPSDSTRPSHDTASSDTFPPLNGANTFNKAPPPTPVFRSIADLFAWAINHTTRSTNTSLSVTLAIRDASPAPPSTAGPPASLPVVATFRRTAHSPTLRKKKSTLDDIPDSGSEFDLIRRSLAAIDGRPKRAVRALQLVEELCHSIDNGRDLQISGGVASVVRALSSRHVAVRANAAWALATCCQNNPPVQTAALALQAVPTLADLAVHDTGEGVRARALFALKALVELEDARVAFEELPFAVEVVRMGLVDDGDVRATRRALNLAELLVQRNLDAWKTQLEAWDVPLLVERLMRSHPDSDVRESAARTIATLDGRTIA